MALGRKLLNELGVPKEKKGHHFFTGLKDWFISPGGIITTVAIIGLIVYIHHKHSK